MAYAQQTANRPSLAVPVILIVTAIAGGAWSAFHFQPHRFGVIRSPGVRALRAPPPQSPPLPVLQQGFLPVAPATAEQVNAGIEVSTDPVERARPFALPQSSALNLAAHQSAVNCLTAAVYYESAGEPEQGQRAVAQVVLNRLRHPAFPKSVCGVVYQGADLRTGCQFSFTCDGSLARTPSQTGWDRARKIALAALGGYVEPSVGTATHYHTIWVVPYWAWTLDKITVLGAHIFYRWKGYWGRRAAFTGAYAGETPDDLGLPQAQGLAADEPKNPDSASTSLEPHPLSDEVGQLAGAPASAPAADRAVPLRADQEVGTLAVDEKAGKLARPDLRGN